MFGVPFGRIGKRAYGFAKSATIGFKHPFRTVRRQRKTFFPKRNRGQVRRFSRKTFTPRYSFKRSYRKASYRRRY